MKRQVLAAVVVATVAVECFAALEGAVWFKGKDQGEIVGGNTRNGRTGSSVVMAYYQTFAANQEPDKCLPGKGNQNTPLTIVKDIDTASTNLLLAFKNREPLDVALHLYRIEPTGAETVYFKITLKGAVITGIRQELPFTEDPALERYVHLEKVSFAYQEITWENLDTKSTTTMEWQARCDTQPFSDLNFDGTVNLLDFAIMADDWLRQGYYF